MQSKEQSYPDFDFEKEVERAKWFKEDLAKGGWKEAYKGTGSIYWIKTFPDEEVPIKLLFMWNMPMPAKRFAEMLHPVTMEVRKKWDNTYVDLEVLEAYADGGFVTYMRAVTSWPLSDRSFVLFYSPIKEIDWYGQQAYVIFQNAASHPSKPEGEDGFVRAHNGGNFLLAISDESEPERKCKVMFLTNNNYSGWVPNFKFLMARLVPSVFEKLRENMIKGYQKYYENEHS